MLTFAFPFRIKVPLITITISVFQKCFISGKENKAYILKVGSVKIPVYCHMTGAGLGTCGGGGWTLVMKTDGAKVYLFSISTVSFLKK